MLPWKSNNYYIFWVCIWSLRYAACKAQVSITLSSVTFPALPYFYVSSHNGHHFGGEKIIKHEMCVLISFVVFVWNSSHSKKNSASYCYKCTNVLT